MDKLVYKFPNKSKRLNIAFVMKQFLDNRNKINDHIWKQLICAQNEYEIVHQVKLETPWNTLLWSLRF